MKIARFVTVAAMLGLTACLPTVPLSTQSTTGASSSTQSTDATVPTTTSSGVRIGKVMRGDLNGLLMYAATLQTKGEVAITPRVVAPLSHLDVDLGSRVRAGDTLAELDHTDLDQRVLETQAAQANAEAKLAALKAGPKPEVLAAAQANYNAAQARVKSVQAARENADLPTLDQRVKDARAALDQAQAATQPDAQAVAQAEAAVRPRSPNSTRSSPTRQSRRTRTR